MSVKLSIQLTLRQDSEAVPELLSWDLYAFGRTPHELVWAGDPVRQKRSAWSQLNVIAATKGMVFRKLTDNSSGLFHAWKVGITEIEFGLLQVTSFEGKTPVGGAHVLFESLSIDRMESQNLVTYSLDTIGLLADRATYSWGTTELMVARKGQGIH